MDRGSTLVFISSSQRRQYRDDIFRAVAMPPGASLRFRYKWRHLPEPFAEPLRSNSCRGKHSILAYLEATEVNTRTVLVPCRAGVLRHSEAIGEYVFLDFELQDFAHAQDLGAFRRELEGRSSDRVPEWNATRCVLEGSWLHEVVGSLENCQFSMDPGPWQSTTKQLSDQKGFGSHPFFYRIERVCDVSSGRQVAVRNGLIKLRAARSYRLQIIHYDPRGQASDAGKSRGSYWMFVRYEGEGLSPVSRTQLPIDSPYDAHDVGFRSLNVSSHRRGLISVCRTDEPTRSPSLDNVVRDFDLRVTVRASLGRTLAIAGFVGLILGLQQWVAISKTPEGLDVVSGLLAIALGMGAAVVAAFGLRSPA